MNTYQIFVDGKGYAGESEDIEEAQPGFASGWTHDRARTVSGIAFGEPRSIASIRNLQSHLERIIRRLGNAREIVIKRVDDTNAGD